MNKKTVLMRVGSGAVAASVASGAVLFGAVVANAAPPAGTLGLLTFTPPTGTDLTAQVAHTSGACPATADSANVLIVGPVGAANPTFPADNPYPIVTTTKASFSTTDPFDLPFRINLKDAATDRGKDLVAGEYDVTARCVKGLTQEVQGTFTGALYFTSPTAYQVTDPNAAPTATSTALEVSPASPAAAGASETLKATVSPVAAGSVQFKDGAAALGSAVPVSGGVATLSTSLPVGSHSLTAVFTPADPAAFGGSTSAPVSYVVNAPQATATTTVLSVTPASAAPAGTSETLKATVSPVAAGSVQFKDGASALGTAVPVSGGVATFSTMLPVGSHSLTAVFTPADPAAFSGSTSAAVSYEVKAPTGGVATKTMLSVIPSGSLPRGIPRLLKADVTPVGAVGTVQFKDRGTNIGKPVTVVRGHASLVTSELTTGMHSLTAVFTPANPALFGPSTSAAVPAAVTAPAPRAIQQILIALAKLISMLLMP